MFQLKPTLLVLTVITLLVSCENPKVDQRNFDLFQIEKEGTISTDFAGQQIKYTGNHLFVYDLNSVALKKLSAEGAAIQTIGSIGEAPGEFRSIMDWDLINDSLMIVDDVNHTLSIFDSNDSLVLYQKFPESITRSLHLSTKLLAIKVLDNKRLNQVFKIYNLQDSSLKDMNSPLEKYNDGGFGTDGFLLGNGQDDFIHLSVWTGDFFKFNAKGEILFASKTIDKSSSPPKVVVADMGMYRLDRDNKLVNTNGALNDEYLFVISRTPLPSDSFDYNNNSIIDVYSLDNGHYISSILIPSIDDNKVFSITLSQNTLYCLQGEKIISYHLKKNNL